MQTNFTVTGRFNIKVKCRCVGPDHAPDCDAEENKYEAADAALKSGVEVAYEEFSEERTI